MATDRHVYRLACWRAGLFHSCDTTGPSPSVCFGFIIIIIAANASLAFNYFGLDNRSGLNRYSLFPLSGKQIVFSKDLTYTVIIGLQLTPMMLLIIWRLGLFVAFLGVLETAAIALAYLSWGNWIALSRAFQMRFYRIASGGSVIDALGGLAFGSLPGILIVKLFQEQPAAIWFVMVIVLAAYGTLYSYSLKRAGRYFEEKQETIFLW